MDAVALRETRGSVRAFELGHLPEDHSRYFLPGGRELPIDKILSVEGGRYPEAVARAREYMVAAATGERPKRAPILVRANPDGTYTVLDGKATLTVARAEGWKTMPAKIENNDRKLEMVDNPQYPDDRQRTAVTSRLAPLDFRPASGSDPAMPTSGDADGVRHRRLRQRRREAGAGWRATPQDN
ncbi:MAG: hypothetical protein IT529_08510 [Burkholderiales bacterium]|nr:hypothetical protein [Burkholderiales bacterium]